MADSISQSVFVPRKESLYVLYGSQMGNSEQAAKDFCKQLAVKYTPDFFVQNGLSPPLEVETTCIQLDDFLEVRHASYTKVVVIFVSSYGVGQAPLGAYRFRSLAEALLTKYKDEDDDSSSGTKILQGLQYAICGLGDSGYVTYLKNPTTIDAGLSAAGAKRIGEMGKADASELGENAQDKVIAKWVDKLWVPLAQALAENEKCSSEVLKQMQASTIPILVELDSAYTPPTSFKERGTGFSAMYLVSCAIALIALLATFVIIKT